MHQRGRFLPARGVEIGEPGEAELADGLVVDLGERGEALLGVVPAVGQPLVGIRLGDQRVGHALLGRLGHAGLAGCQGQDRRGGQYRAKHLRALPSF